MKNKKVGAEKMYASVDEKKREKQRERCKKEEYSANVIFWGYEK